MIIMCLLEIFSIFIRYGNEKEIHLVLIVLILWNELYSVYGS